MPESPTPVVPTHRLRELVAPPVVVQAAELPLYFIRLNPGARGEFWQLDHAPNAWLRFEAEVLGPARLGAYDCLEVSVRCLDLAGRCVREQLIYAARTERGILWHLTIARRPGQPPTITGEAVPAHLAALQEGPDPSWVVQPNWVGRLVTFALPEAEHGEKDSD